MITVIITFYFYMIQRDQLSSGLYLISGLTLVSASFADMILFSMLFVLMIKVKYKTRIIRIKNYTSSDLSIIKKYYFVCLILILIALMIASTILLQLVRWQQFLVLQFVPMIVIPMIFCLVYNMYIKKKFAAILNQNQNIKNN